MTFFHFDEPAAKNHFRELVIASTAALAVVAGATTISHYAVTSDASGEMAPAAIKTDRLPINLPDACTGQTWGDWSSECITVLTDGKTTRFVRTVTIEERDVANHTSTLVRVAVR